MPSFDFRLKFVQPAHDGSLSLVLSWDRRCRLEPFKKLAVTLKERMGGVVRSMLDGRSNAYVEAMNGMLQQAKRAARGFRTSRNYSPLQS